jgi:hypothetical protein
VCPLPDGNKSIIFSIQLLKYLYGFYYDKQLKRYMDISRSSRYVNLLSDRFYNKNNKHSNLKRKTTFEHPDFHHFHSEMATGEDGLAVQDFTKIDVSTLTPLTPEVMSRQVRDS